LPSSENCFSSFISKPCKLWCEYIVVVYILVDLLLSISDH
jgi:hypothetical protein